MLIQLNIKNFALIEEMSIEFTEGFNVLSGETGAGKSIMIDAIDFVLGGKFSKNLIRTNENKTFVEALFTLDDSKVTEVLEELDIEYDDVLIISRESSRSGKNIVKVNGRSIILSQLKKIRSKVLDIHGQHQNQNLLSRASHIVYLDDFIEDKIKPGLENFNILRNELLMVQNEISRITKNQNQEKMLDYLKFQIEDIEKADLKENEEDDLREEYNILSNAEKISGGLVNSYKLLADNGENSITDQLSRVLSELEKAEQHMEKIKDKKAIVEEAFYNLEEASRDIRDMAESIVFDENELERVNSRIYEIGQYKKKYGPSVGEIREYLSKIKKEYDEIANSGKIVTELKSREKEILSKMEKSAQILHDIREKNSEFLENKILEELSYVGLEKSKMKVSVNRTENFNERGFDEVVFMITTNPGEPLMPLEKVLSGGELSRIMLALKTVFAEKDEIPTLIFDEIDTGISGSVAKRVGEKMYQLSKTHQILCITHLPQIAVLSDNHYFVSKKVKDDKTFTTIKTLSQKEKENQIAGMMAGEDITETVLENVREMMSMSEKRKNEIRLAL